MASETIAEKTERDPVLASIDAKIAAWTKARESYLAALGLDAGEGAALGLSGGSGRPTDLPVGVFRDKGVKEAIVIFLQAARQKQTNKEITNGLKKGGIATTSENFESTVATALLRLKNEGVVLRFADGWDLASSYPDSLRNRLEKDTKPAKKRGKSKGAKVQKPKAEARVAARKPAAKPKPVAATASSATPGMEKRVTSYLQTRGNEFTRAEELATQLKVENVQVIRMALGKMAKQGVIERNAEGRVRLARKAVA